MAALIGLPADPDSIFSDMRVAELITLLALKAQDADRVIEGCEWLMHFRQIDESRLKTYQCIHTLMQLEGLSQYGTALAKLYGEETLEKALSLIEGKEVYPLESDWKMHYLLVDAYKKLTI